MAFSKSKRTAVLSANLRESPRIDFELAKIRGLISDFEKNMDFGMGNGKWLIDHGA